MKKTLIILVILVLVGGSVWYFYNRPASAPTTQKEEEKLVVDQVKDMNISEFSLEGSVTRIESGKIIFLSGAVRKTDSGNKFVEEEKTLLVNTSTEFYKVLAKAKLSDVKVGSQIVAAFKDNPYESSVVTPIKIIIQP